MQFQYRTVTININGTEVELEASGEIDQGGKVFIDDLHHKADGIYSKDVYDLLNIQVVHDIIVNQIKGRE